MNAVYFIRCDSRREADQLARHACPDEIRHSRIDGKWYLYFVIYRRVNEL